MPYQNAASIGIRTEVADVLYFFKGERTWEEFLLDYIKILEKENSELVNKNFAEWKVRNKIYKEKEKKELEKEQERSFEQELGL